LNSKGVRRKYPIKVGTKPAHYSLRVDMSDIRIIRDFYSYPEGTARTLRIYTPDACSSEPGRRLPDIFRWLLEDAKGTEESKPVTP
jgi:hypothetical protein